MWEGEFLYRRARGLRKTTFLNTLSQDVFLKGPRRWPIPGTSAPRRLCRRLRGSLESSRIIEGKSP